MFTVVVSVGASAVFTDGGFITALDALRAADDWICQSSVELSEVSAIRIYKESKI